MKNNQKNKVVSFPKERIKLFMLEIEKIKNRYDQFADKGKLTCEQFKKSMGLLGIG